MVEYIAATLKTVCEARMREHSVSMKVQEANEFWQHKITSERGKTIFSDPVERRWCLNTIAPRFHSLLLLLFLGLEVQEKVENVECSLPTFIIEATYIFCAFEDCLSEEVHKDIVVRSL